jgi:hypothetical protein
MQVREMEGEDHAVEVGVALANVDVCRNRLETQDSRLHCSASTPFFSMHQIHAGPAADFLMRIKFFSAPAEYIAA